MKKYYFIVVITLLCCSNACNAQVVTQRHLQTKNLNAYIGTWEYATPTDTFQIVLKKGVLSSWRSYYDCVIGGYRYVKQGILIGDYTKNIPSQFLDKDLSEDDMTITVEGTNALIYPDEIDPNEIRILFKDGGLGKMTQSGRLILLSPTQAHWVLKDAEGDYAEEPISGFSVPTDVILTKVPDEFPIIRDSLITRDPDFIFRPLSD